MKISRRLQRYKRVISVFFVNVVIASIITLVNLREREQAPLTARSHINLSGLNCTLDSAFMSVKTNGMWDSRVVEVTK